MTSITLSLITVNPLTTGRILGICSSFTPPWFYPCNFNTFCPTDLKIPTLCMTASKTFSVIFSCSKYTCLCWQALTLTFIHLYSYLTLRLPRQGQNLLHLDLCIWLNSTLNKLPYIEFKKKNSQVLTSAVWKIMTEVTGGVLSDNQNAKTLVKST